MTGFPPSGTRPKPANHHWENGAAGCCYLPRQLKGEILFEGAETGSAPVRPAAWTLGCLDAWGFVMASLYLLHITDPHLSTVSQPLGDTDIKLQIPEIAPTERRSVFERSLKAVAEFLKGHSAALSAVLISGDVVQGGLPADRTIIDDLLSDIIADYGWTSSKRVVVPGNHDIAFGSPPSTRERYELFLSMWRKSDRQYVTPLLVH
jgi:Calcineurin-like phosphoesterase